MRMWRYLKRNLREGIRFLRRKSSADKDPAVTMDELQNRLRKSNDALNKIISES